MVVKLACLLCWVLCTSCIAVMAFASWNGWLVRWVHARGRVGYLHRFLGLVAGLIHPSARWGDSRTSEQRNKGSACRSGGVWRHTCGWGRVGKCHATGRPYQPIGSTGIGSKWIISHLRLTRWSIGLAIVGRASNPMSRPGPFSSRTSNSILELTHGVLEHCQRLRGSTTPCPYRE